MDGLTSYGNEILFEATVKRGSSNDLATRVLAIAKVRLGEAGVRERKPGICTMAIIDGGLGWV